MAVRRAAGAKWAARRAEEEAAGGEDFNSPMYIQTKPSQVDGTPSTQGLTTNRQPRRGRTASSAQSDWLGPNLEGSAFPMTPPAFGMFPAPAFGMYNPYGMYTPSLGMYPGAAPYGAAVGMQLGMPPMIPMHPGFGGPSLAAAKARAAGASFTVDRGAPAPQRSRRVDPPTAAGTGGKGRDGGRKGAGKAAKADAIEPLSPCPDNGLSQVAGGSDDGTPLNCGVALAACRRSGGKYDAKLMDILPEAIDFCKDQHGCRYLLGQLDAAPKEQLQAFFDVILPEAAKFATDAQANFVVQKLFEVCNPEQKKLLCGEMQNWFLSMANDAHACRVVQAAIQRVSKDMQAMIAGELKKDIFGCIVSKHGNHVIQKCIEQMPPDFVDFIIVAIEEQPEKMASHLYGCRVVQRLLEHCKLQQLGKMLDSILLSIPKLAQDPYGNYVVQHILQYGRLSDVKHIIEVIRSEMMTFAMFRFSSNVVDKCFQVATTGEQAHLLEGERLALVAAVIGKEGDTTPPPLYQMMDDRFGNHVLQCVHKHLKGPEEKEFLRKQLLAAPSVSSTGKRILSGMSEPALGKAS